jgi:outer membrane protein assembly factor BamB
MKQLLLASLFAWGVEAIVRAEDWPQFRGPTGQGHSSAKSLCLEWSDTKNVRWTADIDGLGWSSPVIGSGQIWLTTATEEGRSLRALCLDARSGRSIHDVEIFRQDQPRSIHRKNSHASPTPWLEAGRVYVHFGLAGTACLETATGKVLWRNSELQYSQGHGPAGSPVVWRDLVVVHCDGTDVQFMAALDKRSGKLRWRRDRQHISQRRRSGEAEPAMAYSTPLVIEVGGREQLISSVSDQVVACDPATGEEIWWASYFGYSNVARPVFGQGLVFASFGFGPTGFFAVRADGQGDVSESHVAWRLERGAPQSPSPLLVGDELYLVSDSGILTCLDAKSGEQHYQKRLGGGYSASPLFAAGRIYLLDENGTTIVVAPGKTYRQLAINRIAGRTLASLAVAEGAIYLRSDKKLYRIEEGAQR